MGKVIINIESKNEEKEMSLKPETLKAINGNFRRASEEITGSKKRIKDLEEKLAKANARLTLLSLHSYLMGELMTELKDKVIALESTVNGKNTKTEEEAKAPEKKTGK